MHQGHETLAPSLGIFRPYTGHSAIVEEVLEEEGITDLATHSHKPDQRPSRPTSCRPRSREALLAGGDALELLAGGSPARSPWLAASATSQAIRGEGPN